MATLTSVLFSCFYEPNISVVQRAQLLFAGNLLCALKDVLKVHLHARSEAAAANSKGDSKDLMNKQSLWWHAIEHASDNVCLLRLFGCSDL